MPWRDARLCLRRRAHDRARGRWADKEFPIRSGLLQRETGHVRAVDDVSFTIGRGETLALVGESGCGKTTVSRCILRALPPTRARSAFRRKTARRSTWRRCRGEQLRPLRRQIQMIFQDPYASLNPRMMVGDIIGEPLLVNGMPRGADGARASPSCSSWSACRQWHAPFSARLQRRPAAAHRHRARAGARSGAGRRRRAGVRARCFGAGADHQSAAGTAGPAASVDAVRRARSRRGAPCQRPGRGDVCRAHRRDRADRRALHPAAASLYRGPAGGGSEGRSGIARQRHARRSARSPIRPIRRRAAPFIRAALTRWSAAASKFPPCRKLLPPIGAHAIAPPSCRFAAWPEQREETNMRSILVVLTTLLASCRLRATRTCLNPGLVGKLEDPTIVTDTALWPKKFSEAPALAELVKAGKLPPVEQRIPQEPMVLKPLQQRREIRRHLAARLSRARRQRERQPRSLRRQAAVLGRVGNPDRAQRGERLGDQRGRHAAPRCFCARA